MNLNYMIDLVQIANITSGAATTSTGIDLQNVEGCLFIAAFSTLAEGTSDITLGVRGSTVSTTGGFVAYGPGVNVSTTEMAINSNNNRLLMLDLYKPLKRYAQCTVTGGSSGAKYLNGIYALKYGVRKKGSTDHNNSTTVAGTTLAVSPTSS